MRASVPDASVGSLSAGTLDVRQVAIGLMEVGRLVLQDLHVDLATGRASFEVARSSSWDVARLGPLDE